MTSSDRLPPFRRGSLEGCTITHLCEMRTYTARFVANKPSLCVHHPPAFFVFCVSFHPPPISPCTVTASWSTASTPRCTPRSSWPASAVHSWSRCGTMNACCQNEICSNIIELPSIGNFSDFRAGGRRRRRRPPLFLVFARLTAVASYSRRNVRAPRFCFYCFSTFRL